MHNRIREIMSDIFGISVEEINSDSSMDTISSWDSLGHLQLIIKLEDDFTVSFSELETLSMTNFKSIEKIISGKISENGK